LIRGVVCSLALIGAVVVLPRSLPAEESHASSFLESVDVDGWVEGAWSTRLRSPHDAVMSRIWGRLKLSASGNDVFAYVSVDAVQNWKIGDEGDIGFHEAWAEYAGKGWDIRVGRQVIIWGKADGVQVTDIISPPDYTEFITRDLEEIRLPVDAVKFRLLGEKINAELIWIPVFRSAVMPSAGNPWFVGQHIPDDMAVTISSAEEPATSLENSEIALKLSAFLSGIDVAISAFRTWDDYPVMHRAFKSRGHGIADVHIQPEYHRMTVLGLEFSRPSGDFVYRGEVACYLGRYFEQEGVAFEPLKKNALNWLVGIDWAPGNDWNVIAQAAGVFIYDYEEGMADERHRTFCTLHVSKKLLDQILTISSMLYYDIRNQDYFSQFKAEYSLTDDVHLLAGVDLFGGDDDSGFGRYRDNSQLWFKAEYSF